MFNFFNKRNKTEGTNPQNVTGRSVFGGFKKFHVTEETSMKVSAYYRGVIYLSSQLAKLPLHIKDGNNKIIKDHAVYKLLNTNPNEEMNAMGFKLWMLQVAINKGMAYAEIVRSLNGTPIGLYPVHPDFIRPYRHTDGVLYYYYNNPNSGREYVLTPSDLLIFRNLHTYDGSHSYGIMEYASNTLGIAIGADSFAKDTYESGGLPSGVLEYEGKLKDAEFERLKESWKLMTQKQGSTPILESGVKYKPLSHSPDILQLLDSRKFSVEEIARYLGVPVSKLFADGGAKYSSNEQANLEVVSDTLDAWAKFCECEIDYKLLGKNHNGVYCELDLFEIFRGDMVTRSTYYKNMMSTGSITPNEIREREGYAPYKDGNNYYIATNNYTPANRLDEYFDSIINKRGESALPPPKEEDEDEKKAKAEITNAVVEVLKKL